GLAGLFIGATHTHAGPGQFLGTDFYNRFASNRSGFDPAFTQFLVDQITGAVITAVESREPARLALGRTEVWGLTRNRSLAPYVANATVMDKRTAPQRKFVAINPALHLLRVDRAGGAEQGPLGAMVVFSVHGTGVPQSSDVYNADVWAYVVGELGHRIRVRHGGDIVVGAVQGTHGDVAPAIRPGAAGALEAERVGRGIGAQAARLFEDLEGRLSANVVLGTGLREVNLDESSKFAGIELPRRPAVGAALVAGATENVTPVIHRLPPFRAGSPRRRATGPHGPKWVLGSRWLQPLVLPTRGFPRILPVQFIRINDVGIVGLGFEVTTQAGRAIAGRVAQAVAQSGIDEIVVSSVANEYSGYVTSRDEYGLQYYEGGHTLYGAATAAFLGAHARALATDVARDGTCLQGGGRRNFDLKVHRYLPEAGGGRVVRSFLPGARFVDPDPVTDGYWEVHFVDVAPGDLVWHRPMARVEKEEAASRWVGAERDGRAVNDQGWDVEVSHVGEVGRRAGRGSDAVGAHEYLLRWWNPSFDGARRHRFVLVGHGDRPELASPPFD
ncbi:MAG: neutral/alkaline non-lysosomal ceramidase N-terminal domain-containing protein, partial [Acidimicrobiales bacterium]